MTLSEKALDVIPQGFPQLFPETLQILGIAGPHVFTLKVAGEDLLMILPTIDRVSGQVIEPTSGCVGQVNGEELDDEEVIVRPIREAIVLQPYSGIGLAIILNDVVGRMKMPREARITHIAPECFRS
jgi:hypothetical protein